jgi:diguanylate cyclase (GGDEF)-like protein
MRPVLTKRTPILTNLSPEEITREDPLGRIGQMDRCSASFLCVPIAKGEQVLGLLSVQSDSLMGYTHRDLQLLQAIATQAATAIENAQLYDEARRARDELSVLYEAAKTMSSSLELQAVLDNLVQVTCRAFAYEYGAILLVDEPTNDLVVHAFHGYDLSVRGYRVPVGKGVTGWVQSTGTPVIIPDVRADARYIGFNEVIASEIAVPLIIEGKVIGVFNVESPRPQAFGERDIQILAALSAYATIAIQNARLFEQTKRLAITDGLTELFNHRYLHEAMGRALERCTLDGQPLALIMLEVDNFKRYNDTYGHQRGDEVLRIMADLLRKGSRTTDLVARYGGDEFMIVLPNSSKEAAHDIAERLRRMVEAYPFPLGENIFTSVTLSVGVAAAPEDGTTVDAVVEAVDRAQYTAKSSGGNNVHVAQVP